MICPSSPRCYTCGTTDPEAFSPSQLKLMAGGYDGRARPTTRCKECDNARAREHYAQNAERIRQRHREHSATHYSTQGKRVRRFRVTLAPGLPRRRSWERVEREGAPKWWERGSKGAWQPQPVARKEDAA